MRRAREVELYVGDYGLCHGYVSMDPSYDWPILSLGHTLICSHFIIGSSLRVRVRV